MSRLGSKTAIQIGLCGTRFCLKDTSISFGSKPLATSIQKNLMCHAASPQTSQLVWNTLLATVAHTLWIPLCDSTLCIRATMSPLTSKCWGLILKRQIKTRGKAGSRWWTSSWISRVISIFKTWAHPRMHFFRSRFCWIQKWLKHTVGSLTSV